jgi:hypothetical protein
MTGKILTGRRILLRRVVPPRRGVFSVTETLLVSLGGGLLWKVGEPGFEEGSGDSGGPMLMSS